MIVATWNTEWRAAGSPDAEVIRQRLAEIEPEIVCLTETHTDFLESWGGSVIHSTDDWGGPTHGTRREVLLWSRNPWHEVDCFGAADLPPGRFLKGVTSTALGDVTVAGIVIPYHMSNVRHGTRNRKMWELHRLYLEALPSVSGTLPPASIVLGDFNQRIDSRWVPGELREQLHCAMGAMVIATGGILEPVGAKGIDHIALGPALQAKSVAALSNLIEKRQISDHFGVVAKLGNAT